jgi:hypothetical protein
MIEQQRSTIFLSIVEDLVTTGGRTSESKSLHLRWMQNGERRRFPRLQTCSGAKTRAVSTVFPRDMWTKFPFFDPDHVYPNNPRGWFVESSE